MVVTSGEGREGVCVCGWVWGCGGAEISAAPMRWVFHQEFDDTRDLFAFLVQLLSCYIADVLSCKLLYYGARAVFPRRARAPE